jgi:hypothetical protein
MYTNNLMNYNRYKDILKLTEDIKVLIALNNNIYIGFKCVFDN